MSQEFKCLFVSNWTIDHWQEDDVTLFIIVETLTISHSSSTLSPNQMLYIQTQYIFYNNSGLSVQFHWIQKIAYFRSISIHVYEILSWFTSVPFWNCIHLHSRKTFLGNSDDRYKLIFHSTQTRETWHPFVETITNATWFIYMNKLSYFRTKHFTSTDLWCIVYNFSAKTLARMTVDNDFVIYNNKINSIPDYR